MINCPTMSAPDEIGLVVVIDSAGNVTVGVTLCRMRPRFVSDQRLLRMAVLTFVTLSADAMTPHQYVVMVLDVASLWGCTLFSSSR